MAEKEKQKYTVEDLKNIENPPVAMNRDKWGTIDWTYDTNVVDITTQMQFVCEKYNEIARNQQNPIRLIPMDFLAKSYNGKTVLIIKKNGKLKIANLMKMTTTRTIIDQFDQSEGWAIVKSMVFFEGYEKPFEDMGFCAKNEGGKDAWTFASILGTATTRALLRAISQHVVVDQMDESTFEEMAQNVENQLTEQIIQKEIRVEKQIAVNNTVKEENKLGNAISESQRKVKATKKAKEPNPAEYTEDEIEKLEREVGFK